MGGEVKGEVVEAQPGRDGGIRAPGAHDIEGEFGVWEEVAQRSSGKSG